MGLVYLGGEAQVVDRDRRRDVGVFMPGDAAACSERATRRASGIERTFEASVTWWPRRQRSNGPRSPGTR